MSLAATLNRLHFKAKQNWWLWLFSIFTRVALAAGFFPAGMVKIVGERFASGLHENHPMGHYLVALHLTGFYYTFIGVLQVLAAIMLLIPRTVTLGAFLYFPVILNIWILTLATRFEGSMFTAPLMTLANLYILCWNYEKWKYILPFNRLPETRELAPQQIRSKKFPFLFFAGVFATVVFFLIVFPNLYSIKPRNTLEDCLPQFKDTKRTKAGCDFCNCVHTNGEPLDSCLTKYFKTPEDARVEKIK